MGRVSVARCAELLTAAGDAIERSALSRYCDKHSLKVGRQGREVLVDFEAVREHRAANYSRQVMSGGREVPAVAEAAPVVAEAMAPAPTATVTPIPDRFDPQREMKLLDLQRLRRETAKEEGLLTDTAEVDAGAAEAVVEMRSAFAAARADQAEMLAAELNLPPEKVRLLRAGLKRYDRIGQERFARRLARSLAEANEGEGATFDRLTALAAHAVRMRRRPDLANEAVA